MGTCTSTSSPSSLITLSNPSTLDTAIHESRFNYLRIRTDVNDISDLYNVVRVIGLGSMGEVSVVRRIVEGGIGKREFIKKVNHYLLQQSQGQPSTSDENTNTNTSAYDPQKLERLFACKTVSHSRMTPESHHEFQNEIEILRSLDHPNIVQLFEVLHSKVKTYLILELCYGGDLLSRGQLLEKDVCTVFKQVFETLVYLHDRNVCHRDLKLENVCFASADLTNFGVKLIDFGLSTKFSNNETMQAACGTVYTASPEVLTNKGYTAKTDVWSCGVCVFVLLTNAYPFLKDENDLKDKAKVDKLVNGTIDFSCEKWKGYTKSARVFVYNCLMKSLRKDGRWEAREALKFIKGEWIECFDEKEKVVVVHEKAKAKTLSPPTTSKVVPTMKKKRINSIVLSSFERFSVYPEFKKKILMTIAYTMDKSTLHSEVSELTSIFREIDVNNDGFITIVELKDALREQRNITDSEVNQIFGGVDYNKSGIIHYMEFLASTLESYKLITVERVYEAFARMDCDDSGFVTLANMKSLLGTDYDELKVREMMMAVMSKGGSGRENGVGVEVGVDFEGFMEICIEKGIEIGGDKRNGSGGDSGVSGSERKIDEIVIEVEEESEEIAIVEEGNEGDEGEVLVI